MPKAIGRTFYTASAVALLVWMVSASTPQTRRDGSATSAAIRALLDAGRYSEAEAQARRLFSSNEQVGVSDGPSPGDLLVEALVRNGRGAEPRTRELAERIARERRSRLGSSHPSLVSSLRNLGEVLLESGEYGAAVAKFREVVALRERTETPRPSDVADDLDQLARALTETGHYDEALSVSGRALDLSERPGGHRSPVALARTLRLRGALFQRRSQFREARANLERALELLEVTHSSHPETALALRLLGLQLTSEGDLVAGRLVLERAVSLATATLPPAHPDIAATLGTLANNLQELGDFEESRSLRERAVEIAEQSFGPEHPMSAMRINDLANISLLRGDYQTALRLYERAGDIYRRRLGPDHLGATTALFNLALVHIRLGDTREARRHLETVIKTWERVLGTQNSNLARAISALASLLAEQGLDNEAQAYFERAASIRERALGPDHPHLAWTLGQRAESLARLGQHRRARGLAERAVTICESSKAQESLAAALSTYGRILTAAGEHRQAAEAYQRSLDIRAHLLGSAHPRIAESEVALAEVKAVLRDPDEAFTRALRGDAITRNHARLTLAYLSERQALDYAADHRKGLDLALSVMSSDGHATEVLNALVLGRSLVLDELAARQRMRAAQKGALAPLWSELASARQRYANLVVRGPNEQRPEQYATLVDEARRAKEQAERKLAEQSAAFKSELQNAEIDVEQVRAALPEHAAIVSFVRFNRTLVDRKPGTAAGRRIAPGSTTAPAYVAFVLRHGGSDPAVVPLGTAAPLESLIGTWRRELLAGITRPTAGASATERAFRSRAVTLRRKLWDPIAPHLDGITRVFVVPDGAVNLVPLAALPTSTSSYLIDDGPVIHYLSAERDLVSAARSGDEPGRGLLAIGGPAFADGSMFAALVKPQPRPSTGTRGNAKAPPRAHPAPPERTSASLRSSGSKCPSFQTMRFAALPGTRLEVEDVADLWHQSGSQSGDREVLLGPDASEHAVKTLASGRRILHLATHGFFLGDQCTSALESTRAVGGLVPAAQPNTRTARQARAPELPENPLLLSGLAMAGANRRTAAGPDEDDGILTAEEVASMNLTGTEWAVLSACGTGLGQIKDGEGVFGLRRAFQIAGARTVIMSLWSVEDEATRTWMRALYDRRLNQRLDTAEAVRAASLAVLRDRRARRQSTHPFYWAAFVAAGDCPPRKPRSPSVLTASMRRTDHHHAGSHSRSARAVRSARPGGRPTGANRRAGCLPQRVRHDGLRLRQS